MTKRGLLPPPPVPPRRTQSGSGMRAVDSDAETPRKPVELAVYQSLLLAFDSMTAAQRMAFADFASVYSTLDDAKRQELLDIALEMSGL